MKTLLMLAAAGLVGGGMNALAGGGSFVTLPALIAAGLPSVAANASSTVALYPGGAFSAWVYRDGLTRVDGLPFVPSLIATMCGGMCGALLLIWMPALAFDRVLPFLLLAATIMLIVGPRLGAAFRARITAGPATVLGIQFLLGTYGGFFGGAVGLMMLAAWSLFTSADLKALNPSRVMLVTSANTIAVVCFAAFGLVWWTQALALGVGAIAAGCRRRTSRQTPAGAPGARHDHRSGDDDHAGVLSSSLLLLTRQVRPDGLSMLLGARAARAAAAMCDDASPRAPARNAMEPAEASAPGRGLVVSTNRTRSSAPRDVPGDARGLS